MTFRATGLPRFEYRQWLSWAGPVCPGSEKASASTFRATYAQTLDLLQGELAQLGASHAVIETSHDRHERRKDGHPDARSHLRGSGRDGVRLSFTGLAGPLQFSTDRFFGWETNVRAIALGLKALRAVDRYGIGTRAEQYAGWAALPPGELPMTNARAIEIICRYANLDPAGSEPVVITKAWRAAVKVCHPDVNGGRTEAWAVLEPAGRHLGLV